MKKQILFLIILIIDQTSFGQEGMNSGIVYGKNYSFSLTAPKGWVLDSESGVSQGFNVVFYKKGETWKDAAAIMYTNSASLEIEGQKTLDQLIKYDLDVFKKNYKDIKITEGSNIIITENKVIAKVRKFSGGSYENYESVAYIDAGKNAILVVLSSRNKEEFENSLPAFEAVVKSFFYLGDFKIDNSRK